MSLSCQKDERRDAVRRTEGRNGLDYVEVSADDQTILFVYLLGKLPPELAVNKPGIERYLKIEGGQRVTDIRITDIDPVVKPERLQPAEAKTTLAAWLSRSGAETPSEARRQIAAVCDLGVVKRRCRSFEQFLGDLRTVVS